MLGRPSVKESSILRDNAQDLAIAALGFLSAEPDRLRRFLDLSGLGPHNLRGAAADPGFLAATLDYLIADEPLLIGFSAAQGMEPKRVVAARRALGEPAPGET